MPRFLANCSWPQIADLAPESILALPFGATEQHGPHLPLSTDTDIATALAEELSRELAAVTVAPAVAFGSSGEHAGFAGTLSIGPTATELLIAELVRSATATFSRVLVICAHGGNSASVGRAERGLRKEGRDVRTFFPTWSLDAHAGRAETSLMLALAPERVRLERAQAGATDPLADLLPRLVREGVRPVSANGVLGDPAGASADEGRRLLRSAVGALVELVNSWKP